MTVDELLLEIRYDYLDDDSDATDPADDAIWSESFLLRSLNHAQRQACYRMNLIYDEVTAGKAIIPLADGVKTYTVHSDVMYVEAISIDGVKLMYKTREELRVMDQDWESTTGIGALEALYYTRRGRVIRLYPSPVTADVGKNLELKCWRLPAAELVLGTDVPEIPEEFHRDLICWVLHQCYAKRDADGAGTNLTNSENYLTKFNSAFGNPTSTRTRALHLIKI